jgi:hypothetical protein
MNLAHGSTKKWEKNLRFYNMMEKTKAGRLNFSLLSRTRATWTKLKYRHKLCTTLINAQLTLQNLKPTQLPAMNNLTYELVWIWIMHMNWIPKMHGLDTVQNQSSHSSNQRCSSGSHLQNWLTNTDRSNKKVKRTNLITSQQTVTAKLSQLNQHSNKPPNVAIISAPM